MFSLEPQIVALALKSARLVTWEWDALTDELRWTSGQAEIYSRPVAEMNSSIAWAELVHDDDRERLRRAIERAIENGSEFHEHFRIAGKDDEPIWIFGYGKVVKSENGSVRLLGLNIDITDWVETLAASEARFTATFEQAAVGIAHVGIDGKWLNVNHRCCEIVGYSKPELLQLTFGDITHPDDLETDLGLVRELLRGDRSTYSMEKRYFAKDKRLVWANLTVSLVRQLNGEPDYFISVIEDITARKQIEADRDTLINELEMRIRERTAELERLSFTDSLTGIANRRRFDEQFDTEWSRALRTQQCLSLILIDIDNFKELNDTLGHAIADRALVAVACELTNAALRPADLTARYGGDEFVVLLPDTNADGAMLVARRIEKAVHLMDLAYPRSRTSSKLSLSMGVATSWPAEKGTSKGLMLAADRALYRAKQFGKNRIAT